MAATGVCIKLIIGDVFPAQVDGQPDVFNAPNFTFVKQRWVADEEVNVCVLCGSKFNQLRRKHHCRQCGRVLCNNCCREKIALPQLGIDEKERICDWCRPVAELVTKSRSTVTALRQESAKFLSIYCKDERYLSRVIQLGGIQTLVDLSHAKCGEILAYVVEGIQILSTHPLLHESLVAAGTIKAICSILSRTQSTYDDSQVRCCGITTLMVFCKSPDLRAKALADGVLDIIIELCSAQTPSISVVAVTTLSLIVASTDTHNDIINSQKRVVPKILTLAVSEDELMQEVALRILVHLSSGAVIHKHRIVQDDFSAGRCLQIVLNSRPNNVQILCNAACVVANLATSANDQGGLQELQTAVCHILQNDVCTKESDILYEVSRGIANFARFPENSSRLINTIPNILEKCIKSNRACIRNNGMKAIFQLMTIEKFSDTVINMIIEPREIFKCFCQEPQLLMALLERLQQLSPDNSKSELFTSSISLQQ